MPYTVKILGWVLVAVTLLGQPLRAETVDRKSRLRAMKTNQRGIAQASSGDLTKARETFLEAGHQDPTFADPFYNLANLAVAGQRWSEALRWFLAYSQVEKNHHRAALGIAKEAEVILEGEKQAARDAMARKDYRGAAKRLQDCVLLEPADNNVRLALAMTQVAASDYAGARTTLTKLVKPNAAEVAKIARVQQSIKTMQTLDQQEAAAARMAYSSGPKPPEAASGKRRRGKGGAKPMTLTGSWKGNRTLDAEDRNELLIYNYVVGADGNNYLEVTAQFTRKPDEDWKMPLPSFSRSEEKHTAFITATTRFPLKATPLGVDRLNVDCEPGQLVAWTPASVSKETMAAWLDINARMTAAVPHFQSVTLSTTGAIH